ncbi:small nuclear ribonucleoprotein D-like protein (nucleomorph) [Cryptomonas paramecium]|uniref:Small nuclear ribonucleoprotein D-like protein n=1 Tax=Cryptomonas paramaecium TaxID=2898 RepID=F2HHA8_9CRYP|nr:small nuclear ribonucleoprotein D-like protein [Cryptomonas paramecium]AEA38704.1 small nuclear ribonucleoprotein D-like protein [Cryptomonas paramecium]
MIDFKKICFYHKKLRGEFFLIETKSGESYICNLKKFDSSFNILASKSLIVKSNGLFCRESFKVFLKEKNVKYFKISI